MPLQNLTLRCSGHESRIFDCTHNSNPPSSCSYLFHVACEPGKMNFTHNYCICLLLLLQSVYVIFSLKNTCYFISVKPKECTILFLLASCADGQVRLVDGDTDVEGRVEICFSRRWGTISGNGWTHRESTVVCNDLGYETTGRLRQTLTNKDKMVHYLIIFTVFFCRHGLFREASYKLNASVHERCQVHW